MGRIDVLVNHAGYGLFGAAEEVSDDQIRKQIDTHVIGSIQVIRAVLPHLRAQGGGRILQMSSEGGQKRRLRASGRRVSSDSWLPRQSKHYAG
jgi:NAD(P)-dependent dehydrogenase (short-subunit alcohol dehydrogenase family)